MMEIVAAIFGLIMLALIGTGLYLFFDIYLHNQKNDKS